MDVPDELESIPTFLHMMRHVYRSPEYTIHVKSFHSTEKVLTVHNHFPFNCINAGCHKPKVNTTIAHLQHYRSDCPSILRNRCETVFKNGTVLDTSIWKYKDRLMKSLKKVVKDFVQLGINHNPG